MPELPSVGFVGTGIMGQPMAGHLIAAGYRLTVHNRTQSKAVPLLDAGATWAASPAETAHGCDILFTNVSDTPDVEQVLFGRQGASDTLRSGAIVVDLSTISPSATRDFAQRLTQQGVSLLDAPVTGGDIGARNATLTIMVGGEAATFERVLPLLKLMGKTVEHVGQSGCGQALKACNQIMCAVNMIGLCEAMTLAEANGLDLKLLPEVLSGGASGSWTLTHLGARIANGDLDPGFMVYLLQKDLRIVQTIAGEQNLPLPGAALAEQMLRATANCPGGERLGFQAMIEAYRKLKGNT
jgi:3-hydroxyisobutyrate dehydrogenase-like beta-hydroxyacid dehydrogenase